MSELERAIKESVSNVIREVLDENVKIITSAVEESIRKIKETPKFDPNSWLNEKQVAELLGMKVSTLQQWRHQGLHLEYSVFGDKSVRYKYSDVIAFAEKRKIKVVV